MFGSCRLHNVIEKRPFLFHISFSHSLLPLWLHRVLGVRYVIFEYIHVALFWSPFPLVFFIFTFPLHVDSPSYHTHLKFIFHDRHQFRCRFYKLVKTCNIWLCELVLSHWASGSPLPSILKQMTQFHFSFRLTNIVCIYIYTYINVYIHVCHIFIHSLVFLELLPWHLKYHIPLSPCFSCCHWEICWYSEICLLL